jgi:hypothetical protein
MDKWRERMRQVTVRERMRESMDEIRKNQNRLVASEGDDPNIIFRARRKQ